MALHDLAVVVVAVRDHTLACAGHDTDRPWRRSGGTRDEQAVHPVHRYLDAFDLYLLGDSRLQQLFEAVERERLGAGAGLDLLRPGAAGTSQGAEERRFDLERGDAMGCPGSIRPVRPEERAAFAGAGPGSAACLELAADMTVPGSFEQAAQGAAILELPERDHLAGVVMAREHAVGLQIQGLEDHAVHCHPSRSDRFHLCGSVSFVSQAVGSILGSLFRKYLRQYASATTTTCSSPSKPAHRPTTDLGFLVRKPFVLIPVVVSNRPRVPPPRRSEVERT